MSASNNSLPLPLLTSHSRLSLFLSSSSLIHFFILFFYIIIFLGLLGSYSFKSSLLVLILRILLLYPRELAQYIGNKFLRTVITYVSRHQLYSCFKTLFTTKISLIILNSSSKTCLEETWTSLFGPSRAFVHI